VDARDKPGHDGESMPRDIQREDALRAFPGHDGEGKNVDARDIGAKQSFVALPGHDEPPGGQISNSLSTPICKNICVPLQSKSLH
jgi:hypothetical protein